MAAFPNEGHQLYSPDTMDMRLYAISAEGPHLQILSDPMRTYTASLSAEAASDPRGFCSPRAMAEAGVVLLGT